MPARVSVTRVCSFVVASVTSLPGSGIVGTALPLSGRQPHTRWNLTRLDHAPDLGRATGVEEDVALAHGRLLGQQPLGEQGLPHLLGERAVIAGEASREVGELGVVAAPLAHPVQALEDAAGHAQAG